jgi:hypothetical protein
MVDIATHRRYIPYRLSCWRAPFTFNASRRSFAPSSPISFPARHSEHGQPCIISLTSLLIRRYIPLRFSCWRAKFTFNAPPRYFAPSSPISLSASHSEHGQQCIWLTSPLIRRYIPRSSSCWSVELNFNASLRYFAASSPM